MDGERTSGMTPRQLGMAMPAEWTRHELTLMAWPARLDLWGEALVLAKAEYAAVARAIATFEPVIMVADPAQGGGGPHCITQQIPSGTMVGPR